MPAEQEYSVSVLEDELLALGLKYRFQHLPQALPPEGRALSLFIVKLLV